MKLLASWRARLARPAKPVSPPTPAPAAPLSRAPIEASEVYKRFGPRVARSIVRAQRAKAEAPKEPPSCPQCPQAGWSPNPSLGLARPSAGW